MSGAKNDPPVAPRPPANARFAIVWSRFNEDVVGRLLEGATACLQEHEVAEDAIAVYEVPGAWELPWVARRLATAGGVDAIIAVGAVIRGDTPHFEYVAGECARGLADVMTDTGVPVAFGVLTTDTADQALARAGGTAGNKGRDAALTAIEMVVLTKKLEGNP